jgi:probable F420-dependent oxidoreductase
LGGVTRFSVSLPQADVGPDDVVRYARRAEELGFHGLWVLDSTVGGATTHTKTFEGLHLLTFTAAHTSSARLGIAVLVQSRRNPVLLAKELATVDHLCGGRLIAGIGLGNDTPAIEGLGFQIDRRVRRLTESIAILRALWQNESASFDGELFKFDDLRVEPKPVQPGGVPIWIGANAEPAVRRAARIGDAFIGSGSSPLESFPDRVRVLRDELESQDRDPASFPVAKRVYLAIGDDAQERLTPVLDGMYGMDGLTARSAVCGTADEVADKLHRLVDAGADELLQNPLYDHDEHLEELAEIVRAF